MSALADTTNTSSQEECKKDIEAVEKPTETEETLAETATKPTEEVAVPETVADENKVAEKKEETETSEKVEESTAVEEVKESPEEKKTTETEVDAPMEEETAEKISPEETKKKMDENLIAGRRFLKLNEFNQATDALSVAAELAAELFGDGHLDTFEINFLYGKALLELAKAEEMVLANALTDIPKAEEGQESADDTVVENPDNVPEEERAEIKQQVGEALGVVPEEPETIAEEEAEATAEEEVKGNEEAEAKETETAVAEDVEMETVEEKGGDEPEAEKAEESDDEDDDEPMKLAWELLETCRNMCQNQVEDLEASPTVDSESLKTWKLNHAEVLTSLGEHGLADSKHEQAQNDLSEALKIQSSLMEATSRVLANTTHLLAKAFSSDSLFDKAAELYGDSKNILTAKLEELKKELEGASDEKKADIQSEIKELEEVIPDLEALIVDARADHEVTEKLKEVAKKELESAAAQIEKMAGGEVKDISDMVRRPSKRPAEEGESQEEVKKRKSEEGTQLDEKAEETEPIAQE